MGEPKVFASLSSGLLARKGAARPAMRPQGFGQLGGNIEDLGWNDMGFEAPKPALAAVRDADHDAFGDSVPEPAIRHPLAGLTPIGSIASPVHDQQAELADRFKDYDLEPGEEEDEDLTAEPLHFKPAGSDVREPAKEQVVVAAKVKTPVVFAVDVPVAVAPVAASPVAAAPVAPVAVAPIAVAPAAPVAKVAKKAAAPRAAPGAKSKAAFTLRLDAARHLKLRLACAVTGRSAQLLVTEALDQLLADMPELESMAERAPRKAN
jgi:hypothetical protein